MMNTIKTLTKLTKKGFTLLELLIAIAIVAILAAVAIPSYYHYMQKSEYNNVVTYANTLKNAVATCAEKTNGLAGCDSGTNGIPAAISGQPKGTIQSANVTNGVITITPNAVGYGITPADVYILTPTYKQGSGLSWTATGQGCLNNYVSC